MGLPCGPFQDLDLFPVQQDGVLEQDRSGVFYKRPDVAHKGQIALQAVTSGAVMKAGKAQWCIGKGIIERNSLTCRLEYAGFRNSVVREG